MLSAMLNRIKAIYFSLEMVIIFYQNLGYTDLRGSFDYAQSSSIDIDEIQKFAILVKSDKGY